MSPKKQARKAAGNAAANKKRFQGFTDDERAAVKERARELTAEARRGVDKSDGESACSPEIERVIMATELCSHPAMMRASKRRDITGKT